MIEFKIPSWFYLPTKQTIKTSTTAGSFDASVAVRSRGQEAWISSVGQSKNPKKKKILIADWTLEKRTIDLMQFKKFIQKLLKEGFKVFIAKQDEPQPVNSENLHITDFYHIPPQDKHTLTAQMVKLSSISADELILLDYDLIQEIAKENPILQTKIVSSLQQIVSQLKIKNVFPLMNDSHYPLSQILSTVEQDFCIAVDAMTINRYRSISVDLRNKITTIIITDDYVLDHYVDLKEIFSNVKQIYASADIAIGLKQFLSTNPQVKLTFYKAHLGLIKPSINQFISDQELQIETLSFMSCTDMRAYGKLNLRKKTITSGMLISLVTTTITTLCLTECSIQEELMLI